VAETVPVFGSSAVVLPSDLINATMVVGFTALARFKKVQF